MLFHLAYQPLTLGDLEVHSDVTKFLKHLPRSITLYILIEYRLLITNLNFGVNQYTSSHVISLNMELMGLAISQPILKLETFGLDHKII